MQNKKSLYLILCFLVVAALFSCGTQKRAVSVKKELSIVDSQLRQYDNTLKKLDDQRKNKINQNEIDDTANARLQYFIDKTNTTIDSLNKLNAILIGNTSVVKGDLEKLINSLSLSRVSSKQIGDKLLFLTDLMNQNLVIKIDQDILFEPGKYSISPSMINVIGKFFEPPAKEIDLFVKKYPDFPISLVITANGYADATSIAEGSLIYNDLKDRISLSGREPNSKEINKELSRARAKEVILLFQKFASDRLGTGGYLKNVLYLHEGKGEALPDPKITDYKTGDPRRRLVLLYWSIFPE